MLTLAGRVALLARRFGLKVTSDHHPHRPDPTGLDDTRSDHLPPAPVVAGMVRVLADRDLRALERPCPACQAPSEIPCLRSSGPVVGHGAWFDSQYVHKARIPICHYEPGELLERQLRSGQSLRVEQRAGEPAIARRMES